MEKSHLAEDSQMKIMCGEWKSNKQMNGSAKVRFSIHVTVNKSINQ